MLLRPVYWGVRIGGVVWRRTGLLVSSLLHRAVLARVGAGCRFQPGVRFADPSVVQIGSGCYFWRGCAVSSELPGGGLLIGDGVQINRDVHLDITGGLKIGNRVLISEEAVIYTHDHGLDPRGRPVARPKVIAADVWIGMRAVVLPQCGRIGQGAVIAAGAIVTRDVPAGAIVGGNPARVLGRTGRHGQVAA
ncbi:acyltransferase [Yoonia sp.]|uniref:acyltransferase n=1 Tax=Yoonia sp. TaxID=2212373 RepID=UPI003F6AA4AF